MISVLIAGKFIVVVSLNGVIGTGIGVYGKMKKEIALLNEILAAAAIYGGDAGGVYCSCPEELEKAVNNWLVEKNLMEDYMLVYQNYTSIPQIVRSFGF